MQKGMSSFPKPLYTYLVKVWDIVKVVKASKVNILADILYVPINSLQESE
jgi:hypothetical protein